MSTPPSVRSQALEEALVWLEQFNRAGAHPRDIASSQTIIRALIPLPAPDAGWRTIDSAPKGRLIDIWIKTSDDGGERWADCYYDSICGQWRTSRPGGMLMWVYESAVTHWREPPLPAPPVGDKDPL